MSAYPTIRNPLLPSPPPSATRSKFRRRELLSSLSISSSTLSPSISTSSFRSFMSQTISQIRIGPNKRIMPSGKGMQKSMTDNRADLKYYTMKKETIENEPLVHYNGPYQTLESLPLEKLNWIKDEQTSSLIENPLTNYTQSIVLRKPVSRSQTYPSLNEPAPISRAVTKPKGMFYVRILQIVATDSSKPRLFRCGIEVNQETCFSSFVSSEKTSKKSCIGQFDETFLFDIDDDTNANISVYAQNKSHHLFISKNQKQEAHIGSVNISIPLHPKSKTTERFVLTGGSKDFQLLLVHGTFVSHRTQNMLNNTILFEDFITVYVHTSMAPKWERFWGVLRGIQFELYDFQYKETRPPLHKVPLDNLVNAFHGSEENAGDIKVDIGAKGLVLQFTERAINRREVDWSEDLDYCMYLLPESSSTTLEWGERFKYAASIFDEMRGWDTSDAVDSDYSVRSNDSSSCYTSSIENEEEYRSFVPTKLLW